jgi:hypothetical protein
MRSTSRPLAVSLARWSCVASVLVRASLSLANDASFGGEGAELRPLKESRVRMVSEDITFTAHYSKMQWDVEARYVFENQGSEPITLQVGFPELRCDTTDTETPVDKRCPEHAFKNLKTWVDGKPVRHREGSLEDGQEWAGYLGVIWLFDVTFPSKQPVRIRHSYTKGSTFIMGYDRCINYITRTGARWAGSIGHARFTARLPPATKRVGYGPSVGLLTHPPRVTANGVVEVVAEGTNWVPTSDVGFWFNDTYIAAEAGPSNPHPIDRCGFDFDSDLRQAQYCVNFFYAVKGYPFQSPDLRKEFYSGNREFRATDEGGWSRDLLALPWFDPSWFMDKEREFLTACQRRVQQLTSNRKAGTAKP